MLKYKLPLLFLLTTPVYAEAPCDYKVNDTIIYKGSVESVRLISESIEEIPNIKDIKKCVMSIEARVDGKWYPSKGEYMFGPEMSFTDACSHAEDRAKKKVMREQIPETLISKKNLKCDLTSSKKSCKVIYMNTSIGKVKFMESCENE
tara:strand:+ start:4461 stop:4904 length:444 start_codon:yes stop_codon:yes gene_type:complete